MDVPDEVGDTKLGHDVEGIIMVVEEETSSAVVVVGVDISGDTKEGPLLPTDIV